MAKSWVTIMAKSWICEAIANDVITHKEKLEKRIWQDLAFVLRHKSHEPGKEPIKPFLPRMEMMYYLPIEPVHMLPEKWMIYRMDIPKIDYAVTETIPWWGPLSTEEEKCMIRSNDLLVRGKGYFNLVQRLGSSRFDSAPLSFRTEKHLRCRINGWLKDLSVDI